MYSGISDIVDPNGLVGNRWSYALYMRFGSEPEGINYESVWKRIKGKSSISSSSTVQCEICCTVDDILLLGMVLEEIHVPSMIEYTYLIKRSQNDSVLLYCDTIKEETTKNDLILYLMNIFR